MPVSLVPKCVKISFSFQAVHLTSCSFSLPYTRCLLDNTLSWTTQAEHHYSARPTSPAASCPARRHKYAPARPAMSSMSKLLLQVFVSSCSAMLTVVRQLLQPPHEAGDAAGLPPDLPKPRRRRNTAAHEAVLATHHDRGQGRLVHQLHAAPDILLRRRPPAPAPRRVRVGLVPRGLLG